MTASTMTTTVLAGVVVVVAMFLMAMPTAEAQAECAIEANGCSVPGKLPFFYKGEFTPSCNRHDICYRCGVMYGWTKDECDTEFLKDMNLFCKVHRRRRNAVPMKRDTCTLAAQVYYKAVKHFGHQHFHDGHEKEVEEYCNKPWVPSCLPQ